MANSAALEGGNRSSPSAIRYMSDSSNPLIADAPFLVSVISSLAAHSQR
jgi:hypothetical protein